MTIYTVLKGLYGRHSDVLLTCKDTQGRTVVGRALLLVQACMLTIATCTGIERKLFELTV